MPRLQAGSGALLHALRYVLFIAMPRMGLASAWLDGKSVFLPFSDIALPPLLAASEHWGEAMEDLLGQVGEFSTGSSASTSWRRSTTTSSVATTPCAG